MLKNFLWDRVNYRHAHYLVPMVFLPYCLDIFLHVFSDAASIFKSIYGALAALILIGLVLYLFIYSSKKWHIRFDLLSMWLILMVCQVGLTLTLSWEGIGWFNFILFICLVLIFLKRPSPAELDYVIKIFMSLIGLSILLSLILSMNEWGWTQHDIRHPWIKMWTGDIKRLAGVFKGPGMLGMVSAILLVYCAVNVTRIALYLVPLVGLLFADSKAAFVAILFSNLLLIFCMLGNRHKHKIRLLCITGAIIIYIFAIPASLSLTSNEHRLSIWGLSFWGGDTTSRLNQAEWGIASHYHNFILDAVYQDDFLLVAVCILILLIMLFFLGRAIKKKNYLFISLFVPVVIYSMFDLGIIWNKLNVATMTLILAMLSEKSDV